MLIGILTNACCISFICIICNLYSINKALFFFVKNKVFLWGDRRVTNNSAHNEERSCEKITG